MSNYKHNDHLNFGNLTIDLSDDLLTDTINISPSSFNWNSPAYTISAGAGGVGAQGSNYTYSTSGWNGVTGINGASSITTSASGIEVKNGADITINGKSLSAFMDRVEARLNILQPKPELLEKFEALRLAYEHYKTLEALCTGDTPKDANGK